MYKVDHGVLVDGRIDRASRVEVGKVIGSQIDDHHLRLWLKWVIVVSIVGAIPSPKLGHQWTVVARIIPCQTFSTPSHNVVVGSKRFSGKSSIGLWIVLDLSSIRARIHPVQTLRSSVMTLRRLEAVTYVADGD